MKGSKEGKADGSKVAGPALFPRLHVSDTKKAGPRGPPRNKMALYEQLTIPSHKYKPSPVPLPSSGRMMMNPSMTSPIYQPQVQASSYDSRYSYMPMNFMSTMIPTMGYIPMMNVGLYGVGAGATATSSMNGSSARSTVVDASTESQRVPWVGETLSRWNNSSGQSKLSAPSKKRKEKGKEDDDFAVPTYSSATQASSQAKPSVNPFQGRQGFSGGRAVQKGKEVVMGKRSSACVYQPRRIREENSMEDDASWTSASFECETASAIDDDMNTLELSYRKMGVCSRDSDGSQMELNSSEIGQERVKDQKVVVGQSGEGLNKQSISTTRVAAPPELLHEVDSLRAVPEQDIFSSQSSENRSGEVSEPSQPRRESSAETESSTGSISFRDVVDAFGQQEFWKAQSTIIRHQKIFARQVFELHRVIEVQQLLSKTSSLSLNFDEVLEEEEADNVPMPASPVADVPEVPEIPERCPNLNQSSDSNLRPVPEALSQPIYPLSVPYQQNFNSGCAWQASPYAANPWAARMSSPLMYAPYPGPCSPGYGAYPYMGASMPVYGNSGGMQGARFPTWQQPGISQPWGALDSVAAATAWYGEQVVPPAGPISSMGTAPPAHNSERHTSAVNQPIQGSNASQGNARQSGEGCDVEVNASKNGGWAKGWGSSEEQWDSGKRVFGPSGDEPDRREGETGQGDGVGHQSDNRDQVAEREERAGDFTAHAGESSEPGWNLAGSESENIWPAGARQEGSALQSRTLKRTRSGVPDSDVFPWFGMMSPAKRVMQQNGVIKVVPRAVTATPESAASILLSIQKERQR